MQSIPKPWIGFLFALLATLLWSGNFVVARGLSDTIPPISMAFWRWTIAAAVALPLTARTAWQQRHLIRRHWFYLLVTALPGITLFNTFIYIAGQTTSALNMSLIAISSPVFMMILALVIYGQVFTVFRLAGTAITVTGVVLLVTGGNLTQLASLQQAPGDLWMLIAALTFAGYTLLLKSKPAELKPATLLLTTFVLGLLMLLPFYALESSHTTAFVWTGEVKLALAYVGIMASLTAYFLWNQAVEILGPTTAGLIYYLMPLFSGFSAFLLLGEPVSPSQLASMMLIVSGILVANKQPRMKKQGTASQIHTVLAGIVDRKGLKG